MDKDANKNIPYEFEARKFFANVKNEIKEQNIDELLMLKTRNELQIMSIEFDRKNTRSNRLDLKAKLYGGLVYLGILTLLIIILLVLAYFELNKFAIIIAIIILIFLLSSGLSRVTGKAWETKLGYLILANKINKEENNIQSIIKDDSNFGEDYNKLLENQDKINKDIRNLASKTSYFKYLPDKYYSLYQINRLYNISREEKLDSIYEVYELLDQETLQHENDMDNKFNDS